jgi:hypothetical protein
MSFMKINVASVSVCRWAPHPRRSPQRAQPQPHRPLPGTPARPREPRPSSLECDCGPDTSRDHRPRYARSLGLAISMGRSRITVECRVGYPYRIEWRGRVSRHRPFGLRLAVLFVWRRILALCVRASYLGSDHQCGGLLNLRTLLQRTSAPHHTANEHDSQQHRTNACTDTSRYAHGQIRSR